MKPYYARREEFTIEENCFLWGMRTIIPSSLRSKVSLELRNSHPGILKMKSLARIHVWWPNTDAMIADIEVLCRMSVNGFKPIISFCASMVMASRNWQRVYIDFARPVMGRVLLIVVDTCSKWIKVIPITKQQQPWPKTVEVLRRLLAQFGLPQPIASDNGPQFIAEQFSTVLRMNGIKHI